MYRGRVWAICFLLTIYLVGILLISSITLHAQNKPEKKRKHGSRPMELNTVLSSKKFPLRWCQKLHYALNPEARPLIALVSFPGSGNTWLRYLLQQATGILTGSVYADYGLMRYGFPAESVRNRSVCVVKTHEWGEEARRPFDRAVLLVRSPAAAILAEFNRQSAGHVGYASPDKYKGKKAQYWEQFVRNKLTYWTKLNLDWLDNFPGPMHIVLYEDLVANVSSTLRSLLDFIEIPISEGQMKCVLERKEGIYRRKQRKQPLDPFTEDMKYWISAEEATVCDKIRRFNREIQII
ncbi:unnamed protein product [Bemisia tabaci]|uniref:Sulfotransferase domain-containing protein n=1 Tax=Bemisia tabaci TaxID=7038 RepID=A0A9P0ABP8_BEMTA|nr:unnamed protein product [Bemisia tabaci]